MTYSKRDIFPLKLAMEKDAELSHGAARLGALVCSYIYNHEQLKFRPAEPFPLPWTLASRLCFGMCQKQIYRCERELVLHGYFIFESNGDRNTSHFRLALHKFSSDKNVHTGSDKNVHTGSDKNVHTSSDKKGGSSSDKQGGPLTKLIPSEEIDISNGSNSAPKTGKEFNGSLRSSGTVGDGKAALPKAFVPATELLGKFKAAFANRNLSQLETPKATATVGRGSKSSGAGAGTLLRRKNK